jgi:nucleotide-binding universal stress UspA family protein
MLKLLIAVDGSDHALRAVETVAKLAHQTPGLQAWLLNVRDAPVYYGELPPFDYEAIERVQLQRQQELLDMALAHARRLGLEPAAIESAQGEPAAEIVRAAQAHAVDQIVMGTHGRGPLGSLFIGSVAQRVVHLASVPVLLVK